MSGLPTASALGRVAVCPGSAALPSIRRVTEPSRKGNVVHGFLSRVPAVGRDEALAEVDPEHRDACAAIDLSKLPACEPGAFAAEVAYAYDLDNSTAREIGRGIDRKYPVVGSREMVGTVDVVGLAGDAALALDYKSPWQILAAPAENWQLKFYGLAAARAYGKKRAIVGIIRVPEDGGTPYYDQAEFDSLALDVIAAELLDLVDRVDVARAEVAAGRLPIVQAGGHCRYCESVVSCPAQIGLARQLALTPEQVEVGITELLTPEKAALAYTRLKMAKAIIASAESGLRAYTQTNGPIAIGGGLYYGPVTGERDEILGDKAREVLRRTYGEPFADAAVEAVVTKSSLKDACRAHVKTHPALKLGKLFDAALEVLTKAGAVLTGMTTTFKEHKPTTKALPSGREERSTTDA